MSDDERERFDIRGVQRRWHARLVELTKAPHPEIADGNPTKMYIEPEDVASIERGTVIWKDSKGADSDPQECTVIRLSVGTYAHVLESPEEVARRVSVTVREP